MDFFDANLPQFDVVVMNPPYVRSEQLHDRNKDFLNKEKISVKALALSNGSKMEVSPRSNLYSYFVIHSEKFLKEGGKIGVITPNTWLDSDFGKQLQTFMLDYFHLEYIVDFDRDSFGGVYVEDCIIIGMKKNSKDNGKTKFVHLKKHLQTQDLEQKLQNLYDIDDEFVRISTVSEETLRKETKWRSFLSDPGELLSTLKDQLVPLSKIAKVRRGLTTGRNDFFMLQEELIKELEIGKKFVKPIIASPHDLITFTTVEAIQRKILDIKVPLEKLEPLERLAVSNYIGYYLETLKDKKPPKSSKWYITGKLISAPIIFSYIIRNRKAFVLNPDGIPVRDNFYCIDPLGINPLLLFGLLNSSITKIALEFIGRSYGGGLLKIQVYEMGGLMVPDPRWMDNETKSIIIEASRNLSKCYLGGEEHKKFITEIDKALCNYLGIDVSTGYLSSLEHEMVEKRLRRNNYRGNEKWH